MPLHPGSAETHLPERDPPFHLLQARGRWGGDVGASGSAVARTGEAEVATSCAALTACPSPRRVLPSLGGALENRTRGNWPSADGAEATFRVEWSHGEK